MLARLISYIQPLLVGAGVTLSVSIVAILVGFSFGVILYCLRTSGVRLFHRMVAVYVSFFRGTPLLVQLLMLFYIPVSLGLEVNPYISAIIALGLNSAAYQSEILRAGFQALPKGQVEASYSLGISKLKTLFHIQIPQVLRLTMPQLISEVADIIKGSAIISIIAVTDLVKVGRQLIASNYRPLEVFIVVAVMYLFLISIIQFSSSRLERHWKERS